MLFCPNCGNIILVESVGSGMRYYCQTCPYVQPILERISKKLPVVRKVADDVLGGDDAWKHAEQTEAACPTCGHRRAYYTQVQTRSADEPMTIFYRCMACKHHWKE